jgi:FkbM family methyltransferase
MNQRKRIELGFGMPGRMANFSMALAQGEKPDQFLLDHFTRGACYEPEVTWPMVRILQEGDTAIDVGANIGFFTLIMSRLVGPTGKVIAYEPGESNIEHLKLHLAMNDITNVKVIEQPAWCREEEVTFYINRDDRSSNALCDPGNFPANEQSRANPFTIKMQAATLDATPVMTTYPKLIKIDTEGAEQKVLEGAALLLQHPVPYILCELNPFGIPQFGDSIEGLREFMREYGYETFFLHPTDLLPSLVPPGVKVTFRKDPNYGTDLVSNCMFSTLKNVVKAWPEMTG